MMLSRYSIGVDEDFPYMTVFQLIFRYAKVMMEKYDTKPSAEGIRRLWEDILLPHIEAGKGLSFHGIRQTSSSQSVGRHNGISAH